MDATVCGICLFCKINHYLYLNFIGNFKPRRNIELPLSFGVVGPAECGVKPVWLIDFCRTSRIFNCKLCLFGNMSLCFIWNKVETRKKWMRKCFSNIWCENLSWDTRPDDRSIDGGVLQFTWKSFVSFELGNIPHVLNNSMTSCRRCSNVLRWPFSAGPSGPLLLRPAGVDILPPVDGGCNGVRGVRGERSSFRLTSETAGKFAKWIVVDG